MNPKILKQHNRLRGFSLLEVLVAVTVFGLIIAAAGGTFSAIQQSWRMQRNAIDLVQNSRWAMEFMANEIRPGGAPAAIQPGGTGIGFQPYPGPPTAWVWYWLGDGAGLGNANTIYRGTGASLPAAAAILPRKELANFIVPPVGNVIFTDAGGGLYTIQLTLRPQPTLPAGRENRNYALQTQVRMRN